MQKVYAAVITKDDDFYNAYVHDFDIYMSGKSLYEVIVGTRDSIAIKGLMILDTGKKIPEQKDVATKDGFVTYIDVDFSEYKKKFDNKAVRRNVSLPYWMDEKAKEEGINCSKVLQDALREMFSE